MQVILRPADSAIGALTCRACGGHSQTEVLDLGRMPLAGDFRSTPFSGELYPLAVDVCGVCGLLQVRELVDPSVIFSADYSYASSTVPGLVRHFREFASQVRLTPSQEKRLLEVGCNDGVFLEPLRDAGYNVVGIDASANVAGIARGRGLDVHVGFFSPSTAADLVAKYGKFDVVTCSNVFAHNPDVNAFVEAAAIAIEPERGEFWIEVHSAHALLEGLQWDCFYHEHCFYWTVGALEKCLARHGFSAVRLQETTMHGGGLRVAFSMSRKRSLDQAPAEPSQEAWVAFGGRCRRSRDVINEVISALPIQYAYGAAGRAVTLINWSGIASRLRYVVDGSPLRFGRYIPNTSVPIVSETEFFRSADSVNDWCFVTAHNYLSDIQRKLAQHFPNKHINLVTPLPDVRIQ